MATNPTTPAAQQNAEPNTDAAPRSPALLAAAVALPIALVAGIIVAAVLANRNPVLESVAVGAAEAPDAGSAACAALVDSLPEELGDYQKVGLMDPAPESAAAWRSTTEADVEPIVLRCGVPRPVEFAQGASLQEVNNVQWFEIDGTAQGLDASTWVAVDRPAYVALTLPNGTGSAPIQGVSEAIKSAMDEQAIDPAPAPTP